MKRTLLPFLLLFFATLSWGQQPPGGCPDDEVVLTSLCSEACVLCQGFDGYVGTNSATELGQAPDGFCAPQLHNTQWLGFVAGTPSISMNITPFNCNQGDGLQIGIYNTLDCTDFDLVSNCEPTVPENQTFTFNATGLIPGGIYFLVIDGSFGDICEFSIDVTSGLAEAPPVEGTPQIVGQGPFCPGGSFPFTAVGVSGASIYEWTMNGTIIGYEQNITIPIPTSGSSFELCVDVSNPCEDGPQVCQTFPITPLPPIIENPVICEGRTYTIAGMTFSQPGTHTFTDFTEEGCLQEYIINLTVVAPVYATVDAEICQGEVFTVMDNFNNVEIFTQPGTFEVLLQATNSGCDSVLTVNLIVNEVYNVILNENICEGESITITDGINTYVHDMTGAYTHTLQSSDGCDSTVNLALFVYPEPMPVMLEETICEGEFFWIGDFNAYDTPGIHTATIESVGGCDSVVTVNLSISAPLTEIDTTICPGQEVVIGNTSYDETGFYTTDLPSYLGCDSIINLNLTVQTPIETTENLTICEGDSALLGTTYYSVTGTYSETFTAASGCDSTAILNLTVNDNSTTDLVEGICAGSSFSVGDSTYTETGIYQNILPSANGCDSIVNLDLSVLTEITTDISEEICDGASFSVGDSTFTVGGQYSVVMTAAAGCDSTVNLDLTVLEIPQTMLDIAVCFGESYMVGSSTYNMTGVYVDTLTANTGCDSIVTLDLEVIEAYRDTLDIAICTGLTYTVGGTSVYSEPGNYVDTLTASIGCDSIVYLFLEVEDVLRDTTIAVICEGESFPLGTGSFSETGFYEEAFVTSQGCDSVAYLDLTVNPTLYTTLDESICDGESFTVGGSTYNTTGTYEDIFSSIQTGCDSVVTLNLTVLDVPEVTLNESICDGETFMVGSSIYDLTGSYVDTLTATNGCDSIVSLNLTVLDVPTTPLVESICDGETFMVGTSSYSTAGNFVDTLVAANGCDSIVFLNLTILDVPETNLIELICDGESFEVGSSSYTVTGTYIDTLAAANGCDSLVFLDLTVAPNPVTNLNISICQGSSYMVGDSTYNLSGSYTNVLTSAVGCDSTVNLNLNVTSFYETPVEASICDGEGYTLDNVTYTETGSYTAQFLAQDGCDSFVYLDLTVFDIPTSTVDSTICDGGMVTIGSSMYGTSGTFVDTLTAFTGCDSIVTLNLTVNDVYTTDLVVSICDGDAMPVGDSLYTVAGIYQNLLTAANGCDSTVNLDLSIIPIEVTDLDITICEGEDYPVGASVYSNTGVYQDIILASTGCDSIVNLDLTVIPTAETFLTEEICEGETFTVGTSTYDTAGSYEDLLTASTGCDSIVYLNLTVNPVYVTELTEIICDDETYEVGGLSFSSSGIFNVPLTSVSGCDSTVILDLTTHPCELAVTMSEGSVSCFGLSDGFVDFALTVGTPPYNYNWFSLDGSMTGDGSIADNNLSTLINNLPAGTYRIVVVDAFDIEYQVTVTIQQPDPIETALSLSNYGGFNISCDDESDGSIDLSVAGGVGNYEYEWSNGSTTASISDLTPGTYSVLVTDANGCEATDEAVLDSPQPITAQAEVTDPACFGDTEGIIDVTDVTGGVGPYRYGLNGQSLSSSNLFANLEVGVYSLQVQDANGCVWEEEFTVAQPEELIVDLGDDEFIKLGESVDLDAITTYPVIGYQWKNSETLDCFGDTLDLDCFNPTASPMFTTTYVVTVVDENGCSDSDEITVFVDRRRQVFIPNIFSPNGDGQNDRFYVQTGPDVKQINSFMIFNRWGESVYEQHGFPPNDPFHGWDGMHRGKLMNTGVYVYYIEVEFLDGEVVPYKGDITLMK